MARRPNPEETPYLGSPQTVRWIQNLVPLCLGGEGMSDQGWDTDQAQTPGMRVLQEGQVPPVLRWFART